MSEPTYGIVLAGGLSRRMGGGDKTLRQIRGISILARVIERVRPQCMGLVLNANGDPERFAAFQLPVVADDVPNFAGPLAGVLAGLEWIAGTSPGTRWALSVASDTPFVPRDLVSRLHRARAEADAQLACAASGGRTHPVVALWPVSLRHELRAYLVVEAQRKVGGFVARYRAARSEWPVEPYDPFFNANAPQDIEEAESIAHLSDGSETGAREPRVP